MRLEKRLMRRTWQQKGTFSTWGVAKQPDGRELNLKNLAQKSQDLRSQDLLKPCGVYNSKVLSQKASACTL